MTGSHYRLGHLQCNQVTFMFAPSSLHSSLSLTAYQIVSFIVTNRSPNNANAFSRPLYIYKRLAIKPELASRKPSEPLA